MKKSDQLLFGPYGVEGLENSSVMKEYGVNAVWFHGFNPQAFEACSRLGLAACVEFKTFRGDFVQNPGLIPIGVDGKPIRYGGLVQGVCLSNTEFLEETESNLLEGIRLFKPHGIWLDYLTYGGWFESAAPDLQESCFCRACIDDFCEATGVDARNPEDILRNHGELWKRHKCQRIAGYAKHYSTLIHTAHPDCVIGAYMCPWTPDEYDGALSRIFAQDYGMLASSIDVFTPLIYAKKSGRTNEWGREFLEKAPSFVPEGKKVQLILDYLDFSESLSSAAASGNPSWGLQIFSGSQIFEDTDRAKLFRQAVESIRMACG